MYGGSTLIQKRVTPYKKNDDEVWLMFGGGGDVGWGPAGGGPPTLQHLAYVWGANLDIFLVLVLPFTHPVWDVRPNSAVDSTVWALG